MNLVPDYYLQILNDVSLTDENTKPIEAGDVVVYFIQSVQTDHWIFQLLLGWSSPQFSFKIISTFRWIFQVALLFDFSAAWHRQTHWISRAAAGICLHRSCYLSRQLFICLSF